LQTQRIQINELRNLLNQAEDRISKTHQNELKNQELNIQRYEDLSTKFKNLQIIREALVKETESLKSQKQELFQKNNDWTNVLKDKTRELQDIHRQKLELL
jgi:hypothetical protein